MTQFFATFALMRNDMLNKYIWIVDTITKHGKITRKELNDLWERSAHYDGHSIPHRTFFNYRRDIERIFNIDILCDNLNRYYIATPDSPTDEAFRSWMLDSFAMRGAMNEVADLSKRIEVEKIPSARYFLTPILRAIRENKCIMFSYAGFTRSLPDVDILYAPYFLKLFRQRWYMIGLRLSSDDLRTYALDRITSLHITDKSFKLPEGLEPADIFDDLFGITSSKGPVQHVVISAQPLTAKYLRALPLHHSQREELFSDRSLFHLDLKITPDFIRELLSLGSDITVDSPKELRIMISEQLRASLRNYDSNEANK